MEPVSKEAFDGRNHLVDERFARDKERIEQLEDSLKKVSDLTVQMAEILKQNNEKTNTHEHRLDALESKPSAWLDRIVAAVIGAVIAGVVGTMLSGLI